MRRPSAGLAHWRSGRQAAGFVLPGDVPRSSLPLRMTIGDKFDLADVVEDAERVHLGAVTTSWWMKYNKWSTGVLAEASLRKPPPELRGVVARVLALSARGSVPPLRC